MDDGSGPLPLENAQQATSSIAGLQGSVAKAEEAERKLQTEEEMLRGHIVILNRCLRERMFACDGFTVRNWGDVADNFDTMQPSEDAIRDVISELKDRLKVSPLFL